MLVPIAPQTRPSFYIVVTHQWFCESPPRSKYMPIEPFGIAVSRDPNPS